MSTTTVLIVISHGFTRATFSCIADMRAAGGKGKGKGKGKSVLHGQGPVSKTLSHPALKGDLGMLKEALGKRTELKMYGRNIVSALTPLAPLFQIVPARSTCRISI